MGRMDSPLEHRPDDSAHSIDLDRQPDAVKQFFAALDLTSDEVIVVLDGKPVARLVPLAVGAETKDLTR
jgi:hypothetical protein